MNRALAELLLRNLRGRLVLWVRKLKQPKYLIAFLAGMGYFFMVFGARVVSFFGDRRGEVPREQFFQAQPAVALVIAFVLALVVTLIWAFASAKPALPLTETEINLLLPAPLTRRQILSFALSRTLVGLLVGSFFVALFSGLGGSHRLLRWAVFWALFTLGTLHRRGVSFWKARNLEIPAAKAWTRRVAAVAVFTVFWAALLGCLVAAMRVAGPLMLLEGQDLPEWWARFTAALEAGPFDELLTPFVWMASLFLGSLTAISGIFVLAALVVHWEWVVRSAVSFEDATIERSRRLLARGARKRGSRVEALSQRRRERVPFPLRPGPYPEVAILWKNLLAASRTPYRRRAVRTLLLGLALGLVVTFLPAEIVPAAATSMFIAGLGIIAAFSVFAGLMLRNDLRSDLLQLEILRGWPIRGWRLVAAEILAPVLQILEVSLTAATMALCGFFSARARGLQVSLPIEIQGPFAPVVLILSLLCLAIPVSMVSVALHNVAALALPGWIPLGPERLRGAAFNGQRVLLFLGHNLVILLGALPAALLVGGIFFLQAWLELPFSVWEIPLLALAAAAPFCIEAWLLIRAGGALWERMDPSKELLLTAGEG